MRGSVGCRYVLPILHPSLIPPFAKSHLVYSCVVHIPPGRLFPRKQSCLVLGTTSGPTCRLAQVCRKGSADNQLEGRERGSRFEVDPTTFACLFFLPKRILSNPFTLLKATLLFDLSFHDGISWNTTTRVVPDKTPHKCPSRHWGATKSFQFYSFTKTVKL